MAKTKSGGATDGSAPYSVSAIGIGRSGAGYVDGLLRTGEIEDVLMDSRARVAALVIDTGEDDLLRVQGYAAGLSQRLEEQGIPAEHFQFQCISLAESGGHLSRAEAKAMYAKASGDDQSGLEASLAAFVDHAEQSELPSRIMVCFNLAGGTGSGMAPDLTRHLAADLLKKDIPVFGVGQLPHSGDGDVPASLYASLSEIDSMTGGQSKDQNNPFTGGFFVVNTEHSWQRLTSYTETGVPAVRDRIRQEVTNKFSQDSFMRYAVRGSGLEMAHMLQAADESNRSGKWMYYNLAKFTHPGVQVLPGEALSKWRKVIEQWIDHLDDFSGLNKEFRTNHADVHMHAPREIGVDRLQDKLAQRLKDSFLTAEDSSIQIDHHEFFDHLTSYADIILPGLTCTDLVCFADAKAAYDKLSKAKQKQCN